MNEESPNQDGRMIFLRTEGIPKANIDDMRDGAERIPDEVTKARMSGNTVTFVMNPDNSYHWVLKGREIYPE